MNGSLYTRGDYIYTHLRQETTYRGQTRSVDGVQDRTREESESEAMRMGVGSEAGDPGRVVRDQTLTLCVPRTGYESTKKAERNSTQREMSLESFQSRQSSTSMV